MYFYDVVFCGDDGTEYQILQCNNKYKKNEFRKLLKSIRKIVGFEDYNDIDLIVD